MKRRQYSIHKNNIDKMLLDYQLENSISDEWLLRLLLDVAQGNVVRFENDELSTPSMKAEAYVPLMAPAARETMQVPFYTGSKHTRVTVDKEKFLKEMHEEMGLGVSLTANLTNRW